MSPLRFLSMPSLLTGWAVWVRSPWLRVSTKQQLNQCVIHIILILNTKNSTAPDTTKKIDSIPGENREILSKVNPVLTNSGFSYILTSCCAYTQSLFTLCPVMALDSFVLHSLTRISAVFTISAVKTHHFPFLFLFLHAKFCWFGIFPIFACFS